jgi:hypothetical protein
MNAELRSRLRNLNMEISGLIRDASAAHRRVRLSNLRRQRDLLMGRVSPDMNLQGMRKAVEVAGPVDITHLLPKANNGMSA